MQNSALKAWLDSSYLSGANQSWIEQLYEDFLTDPDSVDANWRSTFQQLPGTGVKPDQFHSQTREYFRRLAKDASRYSSTISDPDFGTQPAGQEDCDSPAARFTGDPRFGGRHGTILCAI